MAEAAFRERYAGSVVLDQGTCDTVVWTFSRDTGRNIALKVLIGVEPEALQRA